MDQAIEALFDLCEDEDVSVSFLLNQYIILSFSKTKHEEKKHL